MSIASTYHDLVDLIAGVDTTDDIVGEVAHVAAYAPQNLFETISDARTRAVTDPYAGLSTPSPTSPPISTDVA